MAALDEVHGWLERELPSLLQEYGVPAASVAVMVGEQRRTVASGVLNLETGVEATTDAVFQIGSVTKVFTATLIMQLVDEGLLSLDDTVQSVLPGFRVADAEASFAQDAAAAQIASMATVSILLTSALVMLIVAYVLSRNRARALSRRGQSASSRPSRCTVPVCGISPASARSKVDLPAPLGPTMLVQHPASTGR